jgi:hypothetical protein
MYVNHREKISNKKEWAVDLDYEDTWEYATKNFKTALLYKVYRFGGN